MYNHSVNDDTINRLLELNRQFYQTFALQFSSTRQRLQPGVRRVIQSYLEPLPANSRVLDLGCGNGELTRELGRHGLRLEYTGVDSSSGLLAEARKNPPQNFPAVFIQADLTGPGWEMALPAGAFQATLAFAVLHHIPGEALRLRLLKTVRTLLAEAGRFIHSEWQFLNSPRLRERIQPWEAAGITPEALDPGDYLLDWRQGGAGLRYVHHFTEEELQNLADQSGFTIIESFPSDGEGGALGLYQVWGT